MKTLELDDTFTKGLLAGLVGGIATTTVGLPVYLLRKSTLRFADFSAILIYGHKPTGLLEYLFAMLVHWGFAAVGGIVFAFLLKAISEKNLFLKGWFCGIGIWFFAYVITRLFKVPELEKIPLKDAFINFLVSSVYGFVMASVYSRIEQEVRKNGR